MEKEGYRQKKEKNRACDIFKSISVINVSRLTFMLMSVSYFYYKGFFFRTVAFTVNRSKKYIKISGNVWESISLFYLLIYFFQCMALGMQIKTF